MEGVCIMYYGHLVYISDGHFVYFVVIWYIFPLFGILY
jgi:hypothetical protein